MSTTDDILDGAEQVYDRAKHKVEEAKHKVEATVDKARKAAERAREQVDERTEQLREGYGRVEKNVRHAADDFTSFVEDHPARAVLIAAAAGFLIGLLSRGFGSRD